MDVTTNQISKHGTLNQLAGAIRAPGWGACPSRLKGGERRAAARSALDIGDNAEEAVSFNETTPEPVEETKNAEITENTEKSVNAIRAAEIYIYTLTDEADEATNL